MTIKLILIVAALTLASACNRPSSNAVGVGEHPDTLQRGAIVTTETKGTSTSAQPNSKSDHPAGVGSTRNPDPTSEATDKSAMDTPNETPPSGKR